MEKNKNFIEVYENAISSDMCDWIINTMESNKELTYEGNTSAGVVKEIKESTDFNLLDIRQNDPSLDGIIIPTIKKSLHKHLLEYFIKYPFLHAELFLMDEGIQEALDKNDSESVIKKIFKRVAFWPASILIKRYNKGVDGFHGFHEDNGGNVPSIFRMLVFMYYLNDVAEGGETEFMHQNIKIKPTKGSLVVFPTYFTHTHKGHIPISNNKYICNVWLMKRNKMLDGITKDINNYHTMKRNK